MTFQYVAALLKSPQNKVVLNIAITWKKKKNKSDISDIPETFWDKVPDFTDDPVLQCDVPTVKNTILDDGNNDDHK